MTDLIESTLRLLSGQLGGRISKPGDDRYGDATAIWAKPVGPMPRTVVHCRTLQDIQLLSRPRVPRDFRCRYAVADTTGPAALCDGIVLDLSEMREVVVNPDRRSARVSGGARALDLLATTDPRV